MRLIPLLAMSALALGLGLGSAAQAHASDTRIWVSFGDVTFSAGRPFHRQHHIPLFVQAGRHGPRYYYHAPRHPRVYPHPAHGYPPGYHYPSRRYLPPPPPPRPGYYRHRPGY